MFADVLSDSEITLSLSGNIPTGPTIMRWLKRYHLRAGNPLEFKVKKGEQQMLTELANAFLAIVAPGVYYSVPSYKYVCPRTAASLERLKKVLDRLWSL